MKTAISLDDRLLQQADEAARRMGLSRSRFFATAISEFLQARKEEDMLEALNQVYSEGISNEEKRVLKGMKAKMRKVAEPE